MFHEGMRANVHFWKFDFHSWIFIFLILKICIWKATFHAVKLSNGSLIIFWTFEKTQNLIIWELKSSWNFPENNLCFHVDFQRREFFVCLIFSALNEKKEKTRNCTLLSITYFKKFVCSVPLMKKKTKKKNGYMKNSSDLGKTKLDFFVFAFSGDEKKVLKKHKIIVTFFSAISYTSPFHGRYEPGQKSDISHILKFLCFPGVFHFKKVKSLTEWRK